MENIKEVTIDNGQELILASRQFYDESDIPDNLLDDNTLNVIVTYKDDRKQLVDPGDREDAVRFLYHNVAETPCLCCGQWDCPYQ